MDQTTKYTSFLESNPSYIYRLEKNTFVIPGLKLLYIDTPKTGGTSIKTALAKLEDNYEVGEDSFTRESNKEMFIHDRETNPVKSLIDFSDEEKEQILFSEDWNRICVIRNPYNRVFSAWFSKVLLREPGYIERLPGYELPDKIKSEGEIQKHFEDFIDYLESHGTDSDPHWDSQFNLLFGKQINWTKIFRFENLDQEIGENPALFKGLITQLPSLNISGHTLDWSQVSDSCRQKIQKIYKNDFENFDYSAEPEVTTNDSSLLLLYINNVVARNIRLTTLFERDDEKTAEIRETNKKMWALDGENAHLKREIEELTTNYEKTIADYKQWLSEADEYVNSIINSKSWKITAPLRWFMGLFKK